MLPRGSTSLRVNALRAVRSAARSERPAPSFTRSYAAQQQPPKYQDNAFRKTAVSFMAITAAAALGYAYANFSAERATKAPAHPGAGRAPLLVSSLAIKMQEKNQPTYGSGDDYRAAMKEIKDLFASRGKADSVSTDEDDLLHHGVSDWSYHGAELPTVVVWVDNTAEVQYIMRIATKYRVPITPFSGGTSLEGHFSSPYGGISLDVSRMDNIISVSEADGEAVVQPGVKWEVLNEYLAKKGIPLFFPLDPGPGATLAGMAGTGCSGTNAVRYGTAKGEWFLNLVNNDNETS